MTDMEQLAKEHALLKADHAREAGISKAAFYKYVHENEMEPVSRGIYIAKDTWLDELYILHKRCPQAVFSHDEAFYYHGLSEREPLIHTMTIYSGYNAHRLKADGTCKIYTVKKELLNLGKTTVSDSFGNDIPMYDLERTICDLVRSRNSIEIQEFNTVLKTYAAGRKKDLNRLMDYAKLFHIDNVIRRYMEVLL